MDTVANPIASPCVDVCELDAADICLGCGRSLDEIGDWLTATEEEKIRIVAQARARSQQRSRTG